MWWKKYFNQKVSFEDLDIFEKAKIELNSKPNTRVRISNHSPLVSISDSKKIQVSVAKEMMSDIKQSTNIRVESQCLDLCYYLVHENEGLFEIEELIDFCSFLIRFYLRHDRYIIGLCRMIENDKFRNRTLGSFETFEETMLCLYGYLLQDTHYPLRLIPMIQFTLVFTGSMTMELYNDFVLAMVHHSITMNYDYHIIHQEFFKRLHPEDFYLSFLSTHMYPSFIRQEFETQRMIGSTMHGLLSMVQWKRLPNELVRMLKSFLI
jgi:hypothetical protein